MDVSEKIRFTLVLSELVLDDAKVEILNFTALFCGFLFAPPPPTHSLTPSCFGILMVFR